MSKFEGKIVYRNGVIWNGDLELTVQELVDYANQSRVPDAPAGYRYELIRLSTKSDPTPQLGYAPLANDPGAI